ncbi:hypothetical protein EKO27_g10940 [Xylaria grammica]|uniref:Uncharacterized protein n=1 Tax=Xylaria grammica TaxID=363999 RepID=A0A439CPU3_9PEZI|nr:hypothetical protein EKO27_g10940 [Xylaria grammica]
MEEAIVIPEDEYDNHEVGIKVKRDKFAEVVNEEQPKQEDIEVPVNSALVIVASNKQLNDAAKKIFEALQQLDPNKNHLVIRAAPLLA